MVESLGFRLLDERLPEIMDVGLRWTSRVKFRHT